MATLISDDFNRSDAGTLGGNWTDDTSGFGVTSNKAQVGATAQAYWSGTFDASSADYDVQADVLITGVVSEVVVIGRRTASNNYYRLGLNTFDQKLHLTKVVAGTTTELATFTGGYANDNTYTIKLTFQGTALKAYEGGNLRISITDSDISSIGKAGIRSQTAGGTLKIDNFLVTGSGINVPIPVNESVTITEVVTVQVITILPPLSVSVVDTVAITEVLRGPGPVLDTTSIGNGSGSSLTISHLNSVSSNGILVVSISSQGTILADLPITGVTYGGLSLTKAQSVGATVNNTRAELWYLFNPPTGTLDCVITSTGTTWKGAIVATWNGTRSDLTPTVGGSTSTGTTDSFLVTSLNSLIVDAVSSEAARTSIAAGATNLGTTQGSGTQNAAAAYRIGASGSVSMTNNFASSTAFSVALAFFRSLSFITFSSGALINKIETVSITEVVTVSISSPPTALRIGVGGPLSGLPIRSIDTMKDNKDEVKTQPSDTFIQNKCAVLAQNFNITHICQSVPLDSNADFIANGNTPGPRTIEAFTQKWCDEIHNNGKGVIFRGTWSGTEGIYDFPLRVGANRFAAGSASLVLAPIFTDDFNRASIGSNYQTGHQTGNSWSISNNALLGPAADGWRRTILTTTTYKNLTAVGKVRKIGNQQLVIRASTDQNFPGYGFQLRDGEFRLERPGLAQLGTTAKTFTDNAWYWIKAEASGSTIRGRVWLDGTTEPSTWDISVTDTTYLSAGYVGFSGESSNGNFDDLTITPVADRNNWLGKTYNYIIDHPNLFRDGDIWATFPEITGHGIFSDDTSFLPHTSPGIQQNLASFMIDLHAVSAAAFTVIGKNVLTGATTVDFGGTYSNGWIFSSISADAGFVAIDHYGTDGAQHSVAEMSADYTHIINNYPGRPIHHQEWGDYWNGGAQQAARSLYLRDMYTMMGTYVASGKLVMFNYWGGWTGGSGEQMLTTVGSSFGLAFNGLILQEAFQGGILEATIVSEAVTVSITTANTYQASVSTDIAVSESVTLDLETKPSVVDAISVAEVVTVRLVNFDVYQINFPETVTIEEVVTASVSTKPTVLDSVSVAEVVTVTTTASSLVQLFVSDSVTVSEVITQSSPPGKISVTDDINVEDAISVVTTAPITIALDATSNSQTLGTNSLSWPHTISGFNRVLFVAAASENNGSNGELAIPVSGITYNGVPLIKITDESVIVTTKNQLELWYLLDPDLGTHDIEINWEGTNPAVIGMAVSFNGVDQDIGVRTWTSDVDFTNTPTSTLPTNRVNSFVIQAVASSSETDVIAASGQLELQNVTVVGHMRAGLSLKGPVPTGQDVTVNWAKSNLEAWISVAAVINPPTIWTQTLEATSAWGTTNKSESTWQKTPTS